MELVSKVILRSVAEGVRMKRKNPPLSSFTKGRRKIGMWHRLPLEKGEPRGIFKMYKLSPLMGEVRLALSAAEGVRVIT
jgi:hypothetical protein